MATVTKIPGFGDLGIYVDGVDFENIHDDEWLEWGDTHVKGCVTIFRKTKISANQYQHLRNVWGRDLSCSGYQYLKKYNVQIDLTQSNPYEHAMQQIKRLADDEDLAALQETADISHAASVQRVTGRRYPDGRHMGIFPEGDLHWHSNESGQLVNNPGVMLLAISHVTNTSTGFCVTANWYQQQSESFRSELDEMFLDHDFFADRLSTGLHPAQSRMMKKNFAPEPSVLPLVIQSPGGVKGLHYSPHTVGKVHGMSLEESDKFLQFLGNELFKEPHVYDHWYQDNGDLLIFDNSITLHRRLGDVAKRLLLRAATSYSNILDHSYQPYFHQEYIEKYQAKVIDMHKVLGLSSPKMFL